MSQSGAKRSGFFTHGSEMGATQSKHRRASRVSLVALAAGAGRDRLESVNLSSSCPMEHAVLPFENLSDDPDNAYFADGIQEEILTRLASIADLKVISHTSTQRYQSKPRNLR